MGDIVKSASKIVLLALVGVLAILSLVAGIHDVFANEFSEVTKVMFLALNNALAFVFGYYFNSKGNPASSEPFGGK